jgi:hypothetical protein
MFWRAGCSLHAAKVLFCILDVLHEGLGVNTVNCNFRVDIKKMFFAVKFLHFWSSKLGSGSALT